MCVRCIVAGWPGVCLRQQGQLDQRPQQQDQHLCLSSSSFQPREEVPPTQVDLGTRSHGWGSIEEVVWPQYGGTRGRWRRRGGRHYLDDPDIIFKLSSQSLLVWKVGEYPNFHFLSFHFSFFSVILSQWLIILCHSLTVCHLMRRRLPWKLVEIHIKFNREF